MTAVSPIVLLLSVGLGSSPSPTTEGELKAGILRPGERAALASAITEMSKRRHAGLDVRIHHLANSSPEQMHKLVKQLNDSDSLRWRTESVYPDEQGRALGPIEASDVAAPQQAAALRGAVGALAPADRLYSLGGQGFALIGPTFGQRHTTCAEVPFSDQTIIADCTVFLVDRDHVLTAGHCVPTTAADLPYFLESHRVVFGYEQTPGEPVRAVQERRDVHRVLEVSSRGTSPGQDWAILRLDSPAAGRTPLVRAGASALELHRKQKIFAIGHPNGLPLKVSLGYVIEKPEPDALTFLAAIDTFHGNSGSPVIDLVSGTVLGVLVEGADDFVPDPARGCEHLLVCGVNGECMGESVLRIGRIPF